MSVTIVKSSFEPARVLIPERLKEVIEEITIRDGTGADSGDMPPSKQICIMEATAYILGYDTITDHPPCTSETIRQLMIHMNDSITDEQERQKLKDLIPDIVNTAPTKWGKINQYATRLVQDRTNPEYMEAEKRRTAMIAGKRSGRGFEDDDDFLEGMDVIVEWRMERFCEFIRELVAIAKFDKAPDPTPESNPVCELRGGVCDCAGRPCALDNKQTEKEK